MSSGGSSSSHHSSSSQDKTRINHAIRAKQVRLLDVDGNQLGLVSIQEALRLAEEAGFDLVEIAANAEPPVCRIMDFGKFAYQQKKRTVLAKKNQQQMQVKQVNLRPVTDEGDYQVKLRNLIRFLEAGDKVKITVRFKGREMAHQQLGMTMLERIVKDLTEYGTAEAMPKLEGRQLVLMVSPIKRKK